jgi:hypothetical protein
MNVITPLPDWPHKNLVRELFLHHYNEIPKAKKKGLFSSQFWKFKTQDQVGLSHWFDFR